MLFFLSRELWQTVRHCARKPESQSDIWYWTATKAGKEILLRSHDESKGLSSVLGKVVETARAPVSVVAASSVLSPMFEEVILSLAEDRANLRICLMLTGCLDETDVLRCRDFLRKNPQLQRRVSTFFFATRIDSEMAQLVPASVSEEYRSFLRLLCVGRESFADSLGLFRAPVSLQPDESDDDSASEEIMSLKSSGFLAALGVRSWLPRKEEIVKLTEGLLSMYVLTEEKRAAASSQFRAAEPSALIGGALYLGMTDAPLNTRHFAGMIPPAPDPPFESWRVPFFTKRARKQIHYLQRTVQQDFSDYTNLLEETLDDISGRIRRQSAICFSEAVKIYRSDLLKNADLGTLSLLLRDYYPRFGDYDETALVEPEEATGWPPDESVDLFCGVYEALDDGLDRLPSSRGWTGVAYLALAFFVAAGVMWEPGELLPPALALCGLVVPACVWLYRLFSIRKMRQELVQISEDVFVSLTKSFKAEIDRILLETRVRLEREIRTDALALGERLRQEFAAIPFLFAAPDLEAEETREQIQQLRAALIDTGIDELKLEPLPARLEQLAKKIVERITRDVTPDPETSPQPAPCEVVEEWVDELVGSSILPLEKVADLHDEILQVARTWRSPALTAPLTDAELHRGFRKVMVMPNSDIAYQRLCDAIPKFSGNPVVTLKAWSGPAPGIAACSVVTGLPISILEHQGNGNGNGQSSAHPATEGSIGLR